MIASLLEFSLLQRILVIGLAIVVYIGALATFKFFLAP